MHTLTTSIRNFAHTHDEVPAFHAAYLVMSFLAAAVLNLGFFAVLIAMHMALDFVKYRERYSYSLTLTLKGMFLESIVDITLFLVALNFAVYLHHDFALVAISGLVRSELTLLRAIGTLLPKIHIFENIFTIVINFHEYMHSQHPDLKKPLRPLHLWSIRVSIVGIALLAFAVALYHNHEVDLLNVLVRELSLKL